MAKVTITGKSTEATLTTSASGIGNKLLQQFRRGAQPKFFTFDYTNSTGSTVAANSYLQLCTVGPGYILPYSQVSTSALGASRVLNIGFQEYVDNTGTTVASVANALLSALDVSSAVNGYLFGSQASGGTVGIGYNLTGRTDILAQVTGGTIPASATIKGFIAIIEV